MSTRGAVAFGTPGKWRGVYNHADSLPRRLGPAVWRAAVAASGNLAELERAVLEAGRWESFVEGAPAGEPLLLTSEIAQPLHIEWVYVIDGSRLHVIGHAPTSERFDEWVYDRPDSFDLAGAEPDWEECERAHSRRHAEKRLAYIRKRFGEQAYAAARREILGDDA